ncbi:hypothetical protein BpHYR1_043695 [Brachionus plicatilis]|uniref:Uncharacterized protein n=1 Tax=Brachionus plicatilis TaxID=10195 RepID=A0A3M7RNC2_BRAPC|nr:hypothetical protein BpHYR1_043695 [Brachionus plicatilis]
MVHLLVEQFLFPDLSKEDIWMFGLLKGSLFVNRKIRRTYSSHTQITKIDRKICELWFTKPTRSSTDKQINK